MRNEASGVWNEFRKGNPEAFETIFPASIPVFLYYL
jgi:hypothetical protein